MRNSGILGINLDPSKLLPRTIKELGDIQVYSWFLSLDGRSINTRFKKSNSDDLQEFSKVLLERELPFHCHPSRRRPTLRKDETAHMMVYIDGTSINLEPTQLNGIEEHYFSRSDGQVTIRNPDYSIAKEIDLSKLGGTPTLVHHHPYQYFSVINRGPRPIVYYVRGIPPLITDKPLVANRIPNSRRR